MVPNAVEWAVTAATLQVFIVDQFRNGESVYKQGTGSLTPLHKDRSGQHWQGHWKPSYRAPLDTTLLHANTCMFCSEEICCYEATIEESEKAGRL